MSGRVTLLQCKWCGAIAAKRGTQFIVLTDGDATRDCADGGREVHQPEPIDFAPLPSEETREQVIQAMQEFYASMNQPINGAAITELEECWKEGA